MLTGCHRFTLKNKNRVDRLYPPEKSLDTCTFVPVKGIFTIFVLLSTEVAVEPVIRYLTEIKEPDSHLMHEYWEKTYNDRTFSTVKSR
jgi:hypothetical protein